MDQNFKVFDDFFREKCNFLNCSQTLNSGNETLTQRGHFPLSESKNLRVVTEISGLEVQNDEIGRHPELFFLGTQKKKAGPR